MFDLEFWMCWGLVWLEFRLCCIIFFDFLCMIWIDFVWMLLDSRFRTLDCLWSFFALPAQVLKVASRSMGPSGFWFLESSWQKPGFFWAERVCKTYPWHLRLLSVEFREFIRYFLKPRPNFTGLHYPGLGTVASKLLPWKSRKQLLKIIEAPNFGWFKFPKPLRIYVIMVYLCIFNLHEWGSFYGIYLPNKKSLKNWWSEMADCLARILVSGLGSCNGAWHWANVWQQVARTTLQIVRWSWKMGDWCGRRLLFFDLGGSPDPV